MFVGHYAVGFALKRHHREIPLWLLFISVQIVDVFTSMACWCDRKTWVQETRHAPQALSG